MNTGREDGRDIVPDDERARRGVYEGATVAGVRMFKLLDTNGQGRGCVILMSNDVLPETIAMLWRLLDHVDPPHLTLVR